MFLCNFVYIYFNIKIKTIVHLSKLYKISKLITNMDIKKEILRLLEEDYAFRDELKNILEIDELEAKIDSVIKN